MGETAPAPPRQSSAFLLLYALAWSGGAAAYVPFLTILLPRRITELAGEAQAVSWLAYLSFAGAIAASLGNILFGYLSDLIGRRREWIALGLVLSSGLLLLTARLTSLPLLLAAIVAWQLALNMMLGPLAAWAGECVPDRQKGLLGGLLAFAPGVGGLVGALVTLPGLAAGPARLALVAAVVVACVLPLLVAGRPVPLDRPAPAPADRPPAGGAIRSGLARRMWFARLAVQIAEAALFSFLYLWLRRIDGSIDEFRTARVLSLVLAAAVPLALFAGAWADRHDRPLAPLVLGAFVSALALLVMAGAGGLPMAYAGYALFGCATSTFLALHSAQTLRVLPRSDRIGRDLGLFNLTNTVPSLVMPWLTLALVPYFGFAGLFVLLAGLALGAVALLGTARADRATPPIA